MGFSRKILERLNVLDRFDIVLAGDSLPKKKPDPEPILHIIKELKASPEKTIMIGDSAVDIQAGKNAGIATCGFTNGFRPAKEIIDNQPDFVIHSLKELKDVIS